MLRRILAVLVVVVILVWIFNDPAGAAHSVRSWVDAIATFFTNLANG